MEERLGLQVRYKAGSGGKVWITGEIYGLGVEERLGLQVRYTAWEWRKGRDYR